MAITIDCACGRSLKVKNELGGRKIKCPSCEQTLRVPRNAKEATATVSRPRKRRRQEVDYAESFDDYEDSAADRVLFKTAYGKLPKLMLYGGLPFLTACGIGIFVWVTQFGGGLKINGLPIPPAVVAYGIAPALLLLVVGCVVVEINQRKHPRRVVLADSGLRVPKGRLKTGEDTLSLKGLEASITTLWFMTDVTLKNSKGQKARLNSMMFPDSASFEKFISALSKRCHIT